MWVLKLLKNVEVTIRSIIYLGYKFVDIMATFEENIGKLNLLSRFALKRILVVCLPRLSNN
jgi:hypothetical protein